MSDRATISLSIDLSQPEYYLNRELSWLEFNRRVLHEACDERTPLLERLKFMAIFSTNLDEFFMVRVAGLKQQVEAGVNSRTPDGRTPLEHLEDIRNCLEPMVLEQHHHFEKILRPALTNQKISLLDYGKLNKGAKQYVDKYFTSHIFPILTPLAVDPGHPFPYISNLSLNLAVVVRDPALKKDHFARIKIPKTLGRFVVLPPSIRQPKTALWAGVPLEQVIAHNLAALFPGMKIQAWYPFRVTRNADLDLQEDEADDLMLAIEQELRKRRFGGSVVRLEVPKGITKSVRSMLVRELVLEEADVYLVEGFLGLHNLMALMALPLPALKDVPWSPVIPPRLQQGGELLSPSSLSWENSGENGGDILAEIRKQDLLVHHPYQSFTATVQRFITQAAHDPQVLALKMTLYRTSGDSPILNALIDAAENGKQVVTLVELKARFDEANNINWARKLEQAGVHVVYGLMGLKTHTKITLVVRQEADQIRRYVHIGTGNYNPKTARIYTDLSLISCQEDLGADLTDLFNALTGYSRQQSYRKLLVAPVNLRSQILALIQREADHANTKKVGRIIAKMNSLVDPEIIKALYTASQAGVKIDLIIRGICCLRPGIPGVSEHIRVISIIGRFLEHSRIFCFHNLDQEEIYIGSADWMQRNLNRRVEAVVPLEDPEIKQEVKELLEVFLKDNRQAWELQADGTYIQRQPTAKKPEYSSHVALMQM